MNDKTSRRGGIAASATAGLLLIGVLLGTAACAPQNAPAAAPPPSTTVQATMPPTPPPTRVPTKPPKLLSAPVKPATSGPILAASVPLRLQVPEIGIDTALVALGQAADGSMDVPGGQPGDPGGWFKYSPTPGQLGPAVILGHVNNLSSPEGLFYRLHELKPGQPISVTRADHSVAVFQVDKLAEVKKATFPTLAVYGNTNRAEIRLITCGGFDQTTGEYTENTVVYGHLVSSHTP